jgi:hypothetical protein
MSCTKGISTSFERPDGVQSGGVIYFCLGLDLMFERKEKNGGGVGK